MKRLAALLILVFTIGTTYAQEQDNGMAVDLRSSGKIYVVVAVITVVFIGLALYLFSIDNRLKKIEKK